MELGSTCSDTAFLKNKKQNKIVEGGFKRAKFNSLKPDTDIHIVLPVFPKFLMVKRQDILSSVIIFFPDTC